MVIKLGIVFSEGVVLEGLHDRDQRPSGRDDQRGCTTEIRDPLGVTINP